MWGLVGSTENRFSHNEAHLLVLIRINLSNEQKPPWFSGKGTPLVNQGSWV